MAPLLFLASASFPAHAARCTLARGQDFASPRNQPYVSPNIHQYPRDLSFQLYAVSLSMTFCQNCSLSATHDFATFAAETRKPRMDLGASTDYMNSTQELVCLPRNIVDGNLQKSALSFGFRNPVASGRITSFIVDSVTECIQSVILLKHPRLPQAHRIVDLSPEV